MYGYGVFGYNAVTSKEELFDKIKKAFRTSAVEHDELVRNQKNYF